MIVFSTARQCHPSPFRLIVYDFFKATIIFFYVIPFNNADNFFNARSCHNFSPLEVIKE